MEPEVKSSDAFVLNEQSAPRSIPFKERHSRQPFACINSYRVSRISEMTTKGRELVIDMTAIGGMMSSVKAAAEITKAMIGLRDAAMIQGKIIELNSVILSAQSSAFEANNTQSALLKQISDLEEKIAQLETWDAEKQRYQLTELSDGVLAY
jgi:hypothetical protein